jgi:crotonobetainyl-CoA:carnitine CoA-transferase CaiB-like acyl-CoA transferase
MTDAYLTALQSILASIQWEGAPLDQLTLANGPDVLPTSIPIEDMASAALGAVGLAVEALWEERGGTPQTVTVNRSAAGLSMESADYLRVDGQTIDRWDPVTGFYPTLNDSWVYLHGNFPHLRDGLLDLFQVPNDRDAVARAISQWDPAALETEAIARGLCASLVRNRETWAGHGHRDAVASLPLIEIEKIGDAPPQPLPPSARPLDGIRMLDLSRVIAGPMAGRTFVEHGATVMRVASPKLPAIESLVINTGIGKRSCFVDLTKSDDVETLRSLIGQADVFLDGYRPGALEGKGFGAAQLAALRPGIISVSLDSWSRRGPWRLRRGYDSLVQAATGLAMADSSDKPKRLPCQPLDYLTGYFAAIGAAIAILRRSREGGSWRVVVSLARTAEWMWEMTDLLGRKTVIPPASLPDSEAGDYKQSMDSLFGQLSVLKPALSMPQTPPGWSSPPVPLGTHEAAWT